jgi:hypothetical protein
MNILFIGIISSLISEAFSILFATLVSIFATLVSFAFYFLSMAVIIFIFVLMVKNAP